MSFWPTKEHWSVEIPLETPHYRMPVLEETGFVVLTPFSTEIPSEEWTELEYMDWKSGGDTMWANMELAYDVLPDDLKEQIEGKYAIHSYVKAFGRNLSPEERAKAQEEHPDTKHPIVRTHPETGEKILYVNLAFTVGI